MNLLPAGVRAAMSKAALWAGSKMASYGGGITFSLTDPAAGRYFGSGSGTNSGKSINEDSAMRVTTAFACVRVIAETIGEVTLGVYERQKNGNAVKVDHDLASVLVDRPNDDMTALEFREANGANLAARGAAYSLIQRGGSGNISSLYPLPAALVQPLRNQGTDWKRKFKVWDRGKTEEYPAEKIWHWKGFGFNGRDGLSPIGCAREALGLSLAGEEFNARLFANGLATSAVISIPQWLKPDKREEARKLLAENHAGLMNTGRPYLLEGGMKIEDGIFAPEDAQFLQLRQMQIAELCRIWRISPHMVAELDRATNNNIEQLSLEFIMYTMLPYFRRIEEAARQLFKVGEQSKFFVRFNFESLLRADSTARAQLYSILLQNGVFNRNEVRELENRNRSDAAGMDDFTVQSNMALIQLLEQLVRANSQPKTGVQP